MPTVIYGDFEWDSYKRDDCLRRWGFDFEFASEMLSGGLYSLRIDDRYEYDEVRWIAVGYWDWMALRVVFSDKLRMRIISARPAASWEKDEYAKEFGG